jgi:DnaJ-class molecular chaperone
MSLTPEQEEEEGLCQVCHGNGRYHIRTEEGEFESIKIVDCNACDGTGYAQEDGDVD